MNAWMNFDPNNDVGMNETSFRMYHKESDLAVPGAVNLWLFLDENPYSINDGFLLELPTNNGNPPTATGYIDCPASYHNNACGISFCDGHAQIRKWSDPVIRSWNKGASITPTPATLPYTDLLWLLNLTTTHT